MLSSTVKGSGLWRPSPAVRRNLRWALFFLLPNLIGFLVFTVLPVIAAFGFSLVSWDLVTPSRFVGLQNYVKVFRDPMFYKVLGNTVYYTLGVVPLSMAIGLAVAWTINQKIRGIGFYKTIYFLPYVVPSVAAALVWQSMYIPGFGLINYYLAKLGLPTPDWISSVEWAMPAIIIMSIWKGVGFHIIVFLAGLKSISTSYYEAATIDGATKWQSFRYITFPLLTPTIFFVMIISIIDSFQVFDQAYVMTQGGPADATRTLVYYIYENGFEFFRMGYASSLAWVLFALIFVFTLFQFKRQGKWVYYE